MAAASPPPWLLLDRVPRFPEDHDRGIVVDAKPPPGITSILLPPRGTDTSIPEGEPEILYAHKSGHLLVAFVQPDTDAELCIIAVAKGAQAASFRNIRPRKRPVHPIARVNSIGMIAAPSSARTATDFVIAELQILWNTERACLISFSTQDGQWTEKPLRIPKTQSLRAWGRHGVLSHAGMLWWADLAWGLVCCDPFESAPTAHFVQLPSGCTLDFDEHPAIDGRRAVCVSHSRIRYVQLSRVGDGPSRIVVWSLHSESTAWVWKKSHESKFANIWASESYGRTRLPAALPDLLVLDPTVPLMAFVLLYDYVLGLDLGGNKLKWIQRSRNDQRALVAWKVQWPTISPTSGPALNSASGAIRVRGFVSSIMTCSPSSSTIIIKMSVSPHSVFRIMVWHKHYSIGHLGMEEEQYSGSGTISYSPNTDAAIVPSKIVRSIKEYLIYVPIPDMPRIFSLFGISEAGEMAMDKPIDLSVQGGESKAVGALSDGNKTICFKEVVQENTPSLILECRLGDVEPFWIQLMSCTRFHYLMITKNEDRSNTIVLKLSEQAMELQMWAARDVFTYVPLPYLARIAGFFG